MLSFEPKEYPVNVVHQYLLGGVAPRPIALVSTISDDGINNLAPFSFYNAFGANPPIVAFSPARRGRDNTVKDTYNNIMANKECVINAVSYSMVEQINLTSCEYPSDIDEFKKAGFTAIKSDIVSPNRVKESLFQMECKLLQMVTVGETNGAANIAICEVVKFHISEEIALDTNIGGVKSDMLDLVGRNGGNLYTRASGNALFEVRKPGTLKGMGFDNLPEFLLNSNILTANNLAQIAINEEFPSFESMTNWLDEVKSLNADKSLEAFYINTKQTNKLFNLAINENDKLKQLYLIEKSIQIALLNNNLTSALYIIVWCMNR